MIERKDFFLFGKILKLHGFNGHLLVKAEIPLKLKLKKSEPVFLEIDGILVPFFIQEITESPAPSILLLLDDIDSDLKAREFTGCNVYLPLNKKSEQQGPVEDFTLLLGYRLLDSGGRFQGIIEEIIEIPQNNLFRVVLNEKEYLLPANTDFILNIDSKNKKIDYEIPEGLLEI